MYQINETNDDLTNLKYSKLIIHDRHLNIKSIPAGHINASFIHIKFDNRILKTIQQLI